MSLIHLIYSITITIFAPIASVHAQIFDNNQIGEVFNQSEEKNSIKIPDYNFNPKEVEKQAEFASRVTGVRKDFLMGMLVVETSLGKNTGQCTYQEVMEDAQISHQTGNLSNRAWQTFLERKEIIRDIADNLGYDYRELKVSCNPGYAGTGGALGIAQFMPDTWMEYEGRVAEIIGTKNPDPWNLQHGVLAMALKVADVPGVVEHNVWAERRASKMYLSGSTSSSYEWYASEIQYWSRNYVALLS